MNKWRAYANCWTGCQSPLFAARAADAARLPVVLSSGLSIHRAPRPDRVPVPLLQLLAILLGALLAAAARAQVNPGNQFFSGPLAPAPLTPLGQPPSDVSTRDEGQPPPDVSTRDDG